MLAACSADADRFAENPSDSDPVYTASVPKSAAAKPYQAAGSDDVITSKPLTGASAKAPSYDYSKSYQAPKYKQPSLASAPKAPQVSAPDYDTAEAPSAPTGGTVTVGPGMTLYSIARANNLSVSQLASANNIKAPYAVHTGQKLRIPGNSQPAMPQTAAAKAPAKPFKEGPSVDTSSSQAGLHRVGSGETLFSLGRKYGVSPYSIASANGLPNNAQLTLGQQVRIPGAKGGTIAAAPKKATSAPATQSASIDLPDTDETETAPAKQQTLAAAPKAEPAAPAAGQVAENAPIEGGSAGMRWPVRGKVISGFGPKTNGLKNEGINIAVPEGTSVRAAEGGVVAYSGNELKGYGNLVLIRHDSGYVTAYAHAKELFVKRGDTVKRGDVIAKAGQTGSVSSPQLHFEVRKGATALDPMKFLSSATASN
jgi:murein DD-endopeptidase MepM/ murein hydrolase activator NlpD